MFVITLWFDARKFTLWQSRTGLIAWLYRFNIEIAMSQSTEITLFIQSLANKTVIIKTGSEFGCTELAKKCFTASSEAPFTRGLSNNISRKSRRIFWKCLPRTLRFGMPVGFRTDSLSKAVQATSMPFSSRVAALRIQRPAQAVVRRRSSVPSQHVSVWLDTLEIAVQIASRRIRLAGVLVRRWGR